MLRAENQVKSVCCEPSQIVEQRSDVACFACDSFLFCMLSHRIKLKDIKLYFCLFLLPLVFGCVLSFFLKCDCGSLIRELLIWSFLQYFLADTGFQVLASLRKRRDVPVTLSKREAACQWCSTVWL